MKFYKYSFFCFLLVFFPIFLNYNFLPFSKYGYYTKSIIKIEKSEWDDNFLNRMKGYRDPEFYWFSISLPEDFYISESYKKGRIPFYNPYSGCGYFTFSSGQFRPFNPFKIPFYIYPNLFTYSLSLFFLLIFGSFFFFKFLKLKGFSEEGAFVGTIFFSLNPFILDRIYQTDGSAYLFLPFVFYVIEKFGSRNTFEFSFLYSISLFLMLSLSHPVLFGLFSVLSFFYYFLKNGLRIKTFSVLFLTIILTMLYSLPYYLPLILEFKDKFLYKSIFYALYELSYKSLFLPSSSLFFFPQVLVIFIYSFFKRDKFYVDKILSLIILILLSGFKIFEPLIYFIERKLFIHIFYFKPILFFVISILIVRYFEEFLNENFLRRFILFLLLLINLVFILVFHYEEGSISKEFCSYPLLLFLLFFSFSLFYLLYPYLKFSFKREVILLLFVLPFIFPQPLDFLFWNRAEITTLQSVKYLKGKYPSERVVSIGFNPGFVVPPNWGSYFGIRQGEINSVIFNGEFFKMFYNKKYPPTMVAYNYPEIKAFEQMGAKFLLTPKNCPKIDEGFFKGLKLIKEFDDSYLYELTEGKGRIFFAEKIEFRDKNFENISEQIVRAGKGKDGFVVLDYDESLKDYYIKENSERGEIKILKDSIDEIVIETICNDDEFLVIRDLFEGKFKAFVDGKQVEIYRVNGSFSGLKVERGKKQITLKYDGKVEKISIYFSIFSLLISFLLFLVLKFYLKNGSL